MEASCATRIVIAILNESESESLRGLRNGLAGKSGVWACASRSEALRVMQHVDACAVVTDLRDDVIATLRAFVEAVHQRSAYTPVIGIVSPTPAELRKMAPAVRAGVAEIAIIGIDDVAAVVLAFVEPPPYDSAVAYVIAELAPWVERGARPIVDYCVREARRGLSVEQLCAGLYQSRSTINRRLAAASLAPPSEVIAWARLLVAARLLQASTQTVAATAKVLGFTSTSMLRRITRRCSGRLPTQLRDPMAIPELIRDFTTGRTRVG